MMKNKKIFVLLSALVLLVGCAVGATVAWLIAETPPVINTFTTGDIGIILNENNFVPDDMTELLGQEMKALKVMPGMTFQKNPTVTVEAGSADCFVRCYTIVWWEPVADTHFRAADGLTWFVGKDDAWKSQQILLDTTNNEVLGILIEQRYDKIVEASDADQELPSLFTAIKVPGSVATEDFLTLNNFRLTILAQAVQADGFEDENGEPNMEAAFAAAGVPGETLKFCVDASGNPLTLQQIIDALNNQTPAVDPDDGGTDDNTDNGGES